MPGKSVVVLLMLVCGNACAQVGEFIELRVPGMAATRCTGVSGDGQRAAGQVLLFTGNERAVSWDIWSGAGARNVAQGGQATDTYVGGLTHDGSYVACTQYFNASCSEGGIASGAVTDSGLFVPTVSPGLACQSVAVDVSDNGMVVGDVYASPTRGYLWRLGMPTVTLLQPAGTYVYSSAQAVSADGHVIAGACSGSTGVRAAYWRDGTPNLISYLPNTAISKFSRTFAMARDGSYIVGESTSGAAGNAEAPFRFAVATGVVQQIGTNPANIRMIATGVSSRGEIIVGHYFSLITAQREGAWIWRDGHGVVNMQDMLTNELGVNITGWNLKAAMDVSDDGSVVVGEGINPAGQSVGWAVRITGNPAPCVADFNQDGGVDGADIEAFIYAFSEGMESADMNADGGVDGSDMEGFFIPWFAGC